MSDAKYLGLTVNKLAKIAYDLETENAKLRDACTLLFDIAHAADLELDREILTMGLVIELQELGVDAEL